MWMVGIQDVKPRQKESRIGLIVSARKSRLDLDGVDKAAEGRASCSFRENFLREFAMPSGIVTTITNQV